MFKLSGLKLLNWFKMLSKSILPHLLYITPETIQTFQPSIFYLYNFTCHLGYPWGAIVIVPARKVLITLWYPLAISKTPLQKKTCSCGDRLPCLNTRMGTLNNNLTDDLCEQWTRKLNQPKKKKNLAMRKKAIFEILFDFNLYWHQRYNVSN